MKNNAMILCSTVLLHDHDIPQRVASTLWRLGRKANWKDFINLALFSDPAGTEVIEAAASAARR